MPVGKGQFSGYTTELGGDPNVRARGNSKAAMAMTESDSHTRHSDGNAMGMAWQWTVWLNQWLNESNGTIIILTSIKTIAVSVSYQYHNYATGYQTSTSSRHRHSSLGLWRYGPMAISLRPQGLKRPDRIYTTCSQYKSYATSQAHVTRTSH